MTSANKSKELYIKLMELLDYTEYRSQTDDAIFKSLEQWYKDVLYKYSSTTSISLDAAQRLIEEAGYGYILNVISFNQQQTQLIAMYLPLISALKGSKEGLELVLSIMGTTYQMSESRESSELDTYTYSIDLLSIHNSAVTFSDFLNKFSTFSRKYVYPLLAAINVNMIYTYRTLYFATIARCKYNYIAKVQNPVNP
jgi:hypothetical protein